MGEHNLRSELTEPPGDLTHENRLENCIILHHVWKECLKIERQNTDFIHSGRNRKCPCVIHINHNMQWSKGS